MLEKWQRSEGGKRGGLFPGRANGGWFRRARPLRPAGLRAVFLLGCVCFWLAAGFLPEGRAQLWKPVTLPGASLYRARSLVVDPRNDSIIYMVSPGGGVWKTTDGGLFQWLPLFDSAYYGQVCSLALDPRSPDVLYAGTGDDESPRPSQGVARSADGGRSWNIGLRFTSQPVCSLAVDPTNGARVVAGSAEGLFLSTDTGATWRKVLANPITAAAFDAQGNLYAGQLGPDAPGARDKVLARSSDGGLTWTNFSLPVPSTLAASAKTAWVSVLAPASVLYVAVSYRALLDVFTQSSTVVMDFYRSSDGGVSWTVTPGIGGSTPPAVIFTDPAAKKLYVTGTNLLVSLDEGNNWSTISTLSTQFHDGVFSGGLILLAGETGIELANPAPGSPPTGIVMPSLPLGQFLDVAVDAAGNRWAAGLQGLFSSNPAAAAVSGAGLGSVVAPTANSRNVLAAGNASVYNSTNGGGAFSSTTAIPSSELRAPFPPLALTPNNAATAFVAGQRLYRTTNSGSTWASYATIDPSQSNVVVALTISPSGGRTMYAASACLHQVTLSNCPSNSTIWQSTNAGASWAQKSAVLGLVNRLAADPRQTNTVYAAVGGFPAGPSATAGTIPADLLRSTDGGATWTSVRGNLPRVPINAIVIDPTSVPAATPPTPIPGPGGIIIFPPGGFGSPLLQPAQTLYVGTDAGVFVSFNAGTQWMAIHAGLPPAQITQLSLQQPGGTLEAATFGRGIYQAPVTGLAPTVIANPISSSLTLSQGAATSLVLSLANVSAVAQNWQLTPVDSWLKVPASSGTLPPGGSSNSTVQISAAGLPIGTYLGRLQLTSGILQQDILVTLQVTTPPASMTIASGNNATGAVGTTLPPLVVSLLDPVGAPVPGVAVSFAIMGGGGSLSSLTSVSDAGGRAGTVLTLPSSPATVQVSATAGSFAVTFTATAVHIISPTLNANSVVNAATFNPGVPPSPGSMVAIYGQSLAGSSAAAQTLPLPTSLQGTSVLLGTSSGNVALPLFYVSPTQINALMPLEAAPGTYTLTVVANAVISNSVRVTLAPFSPGIFTMNSSGQGQGIFVKTDGSTITAANPARAGDVVTLYATGLGGVNPPVASGDPAASEEPFNRTVLAPNVFFDSFPAQVLFSGLAPGFAGLYQVNVRVPAQVSPASNISVSLTIGGVTSNRVAVPVR